MTITYIGPTVNVAVRIGYGRDEPIVLVNQLRDSGIRSVFRHQLNLEIASQVHRCIYSSAYLFDDEHAGGCGDPFAGVHAALQVDDTFIGAVAAGDGGHVNAVILVRVTDDGRPEKASL
jgi:hypothetical protein